MAIKEKCGLQDNLQDQGKLSTVDRLSAHKLIILNANNTNPSTSHPLTHVHDGECMCKRIEYIIISAIPLATSSFRAISVPERIMIQ